MQTRRPRPQRALFYGAVALQLLFLTGMIAARAFTLYTGDRVLLRTEPVDPRDLFRGDYVRLRYEVSHLDPQRLAPGVTRFERGRVVWVVLQRGQPHWRAVALSARRPASRDGQVALRGRVRETLDLRNLPTAPARPAAPPGAQPPQPQPEFRPEVEIEYGIESFFVPEGQGRPLEDRARRLDAEVAVDRFGRAALARLFLDGREVRFR